MDLPSQAPAHVLQELCTAAELHKVPVRLLLGVAWVESRFNPNAGPSRTGACGLMQLPPAVAVALGVHNPWNVAQAVQGAARFFARYREQLGTWDAAVACYAWGPRNVIANPDPTKWPTHVGAYVRNVNRAGHAVPLPYTGPVWMLDLGEVKRSA